MRKCNEEQGFARTREASVHFAKDLLAQHSEYPFIAASN
jgi:hypothetical protein